MNEELEKLRKEIDAIDHEFLSVLAKRMDVVSKVGKLKKTLGLPAAAEERRQQVLKFYLMHAKKIGLSEKLAEKLYELIHEHALEIEKK